MKRRQDGDRADGSARPDRDEAEPHDETEAEGGRPAADALARVPPLTHARRRRGLVMLAGGTLAQTLALVGAALAARHAVEARADHWLAPGMLIPLAAFAAALLTAAALRRTLSSAGEALAQDWIAEVRLTLFDALLTFSPDHRQRRSRGAVLLRFIGDAQALRGWAARGAPGLAAAAISLPCLLLGLALLDTMLATVALGWVALAVFALWRTLPPLVAAVREARLRQAYVASNMQDRIAALPVVQAAAQGRRERARLERRIQRLAAASVQRARAQARLRWTLDLALVGLAVSLVLAWHAGSGEVATLVGTTALLALLAAPMRRVTTALADEAAADVARERIADFLADAETTPPASSAPLPREPRLEIAGLVLPGARPGSALAAQVPWGRVVALVGGAGSGKTRLLETLARLRPLEMGEVSFGERALASIGLREFAQRVSHIGVDAVPLRGTVGDNLRYRRRRAGLEELRRACRAAGWPGDLDDAAMARRIRDAGANLGSHERRALVLARALVGEPALLLVDELEQVLAGEPEADFARLREAFRGTLIFSTSDRRLAALADECWSLDACAVHNNSADGHRRADGPMPTEGATPQLDATPGTSAKAAADTPPAESLGPAPDDAIVPPNQGNGSALRLVSGNT